MKVLYFDCAMGAAGDMLMGALYELCPDREGFLRDLNGALAGLAEVSAEPDSKRGIRGTHMRVLIGGREEGRSPRRSLSTTITTITSPRRSWLKRSTRCPCRSG